MANPKKDLVWYACYGSNIDDTRFFKYLQGGVLPTIGNETRTYKACPNGTELPLSSRPYILNQKLIFGLESQKTWAGHGVGFISNKKDKRIKTFAKIYLISRDQFNFLFAGENGRSGVKVDYRTLHKDKKLEFGYNFYGKLILLNDSLDGYPVYTFTNEGTPAFNAPCKEYIAYIAKGIIDTHKIDLKPLVVYFRNLNTGFTNKKLKEIIEPLYQKK